jgi:hypothetical protein
LSETASATHDPDSASVDRDLVSKSAEKDVKDANEMNLIEKLESEKDATVKNINKGILAYD